MEDFKDLEVKYSTPTHTVRLAKHCDYEGVMGISEGIYGGMDILPTVFHEYLDDPNRIGISMEDRTSKKIVSTFSWLSEQLILS